MNILPLHKRFVNQDLADIFNKVCIQEWDFENQNSFDLVSLSDELIASSQGNDDLKKAIEFIAVSANNSGKENGYHNPMHTAQVVMMTAYFAKQSGMNDRDYLISVCAAFGHDVSHPGITNPQDDIYKNERYTAQQIVEIMRHCGVGEDAVLDVEVMIHSTSPNGPHEYVKGTVDLPVIESQDRLINNDRLMNMTQILLDSDIFTGAGADLDAWRFATVKLNAETRKAGGTIDFCTPESRLFFFDQVVGKNGFCSNIARELANDNFLQMRKQTQHVLCPKS